MDVSALNNVTATYRASYLQEASLLEETSESFDSIYTAMLDALNETNELQKSAETEEIKFALGESENTHDLLIAQSKANVALQYTVAVRDKLIDGYKELMQMQI
ncbi:MAG: flagellar hook-basal body complex protein FliE [Agathobacter sp.]|nr:flagellar hook-basal body complex protein FliE [Agathobacter sp.]